MFLSTFSVRRPVATVVILIALMAAGLVALSKLKVNQNPDIDLPMLVVDIAFPGDAPGKAISTTSMGRSISGF